MASNQANTFESALHSLFTCQQAYFADNNQYATNILDLGQYIGHPVVYHFAMLVVQDYIVFYNWLPFVEMGAAGTRYIGELNTTNGETRTILATESQLQEYIAWMGEFGTGTPPL